MVDAITFENNIQSWIAGLLPSATVIFAEQAADAIRPDPPFITLNISGFNRVGRDDEYVNASEELESKGNRVIPVSIQFFAQDSTVFDMADIIVTALQREDDLSALHANGISFWRNSEITNVSEIVQDGWEKRAAFTAFFAIGVTKAVTVDIIDQTNIDYTVDGPDGNPAVTDSFNVGG